jgi:hypothetical protein
MELPTMRVEILYETQAEAVAAWDQVVITVTRTGLSLDAIRCSERAMKAKAAERPMCTLAVFGQRTALPDSDLLRVMSQVVQASPAICGARVVPGRGLWATALRGMTNAPGLSSPPDRPRKTFHAIDAAAAWLATIMQRDTAFRAQLTTITGTLLYGSPSFRRDSQVADYLTNDGSFES